MILALLGMMLNVQQYSDNSFKEDTRITFVYDKSDELIISLILMVCDYHSDFDIREVKQQDWFAAKVVFVIDEQCNQYKVDKITFENTDGDFAVCEIGNDIIDDIFTNQFDHLYFEMCEELVSRSV